MGNYQFETIPAILASTLTSRGEANALARMDRARADWTIWRDLVRRIEAVAEGLFSLGVAPGDRVAHLAENRTEWIVTDLALHAARAVHVPMHASLAADQIAYQVRHSGARILIASRMELVRAVAPQCESLATIVLYERAEDAKDSDEGPAVISYDSLVVEFLPRDEGRLVELASHSTRPDDLATILYTSGTTGEPKGVMLSQQNLASNAVATCRAVGSSVDDLRLCFLPLSHIYARTCDLYTWLLLGSRLAIARGRETVLDDCQTIRPTLINGVPYFYQKLVDGLRGAGIAEEPGALKARLGGNIQYCFCGGAALPAPVADYFEQQGVALLPGYGLTESSPVIAVGRPGAWRHGSVGPPIDNIEVRIDADGEILTRGPHVMLGYWKDEAATDEVIRDGWLHTGDLGEIDADGHLFIRGRKKEILVLATGKNVAPALVEGLLTSSPLIEQAMVVGDDRKFVAALIVPSPDALREEIVGRRIPVTNAEQALAHERVYELYQQEIQRVLASIAEYERVRKFKLLNRAFSIEQGEMTAKLSLRRDVIADHFCEEIEALYK